MSKPFKVDEALDAAKLAELEAFCREKRRTVDAVHEWLLAEGFTISRGAVGNWKAALDARLEAERFRRSGDFATSILQVAKESGAVGISDAALLRLTQVLFEQTAMLDADAQIDAGDLLNMSLALKAAVGTKQGIERLREEMADRQKAAVEKAEQAAKTGASAGDVVATIKAALGIAA